MANCLVNTAFRLHQSVSAFNRSPIPTNLTRIFSYQSLQFASEEIEQISVWRPIWA